MSVAYKCWSLCVERCSFLKQISVFHIEVKFTKVNRTEYFYTFSLKREKAKGKIGLY